MMDETSENLIGVHARIEDAGVLADMGRYEGALLMLLVAVAATSRKRYVKFRGKDLPIEDFLYKFLRCKLVHEGSVPDDLQPMSDEAVLTIDYNNGSGLNFSQLLLSRLNDILWRVPENSHQEGKP